VGTLCKSRFYEGSLILHQKRDKLSLCLSSFAVDIKTVLAGGRNSLVRQEGRKKICLEPLSVVVDLEHTKGQ
jgi:hypothetical protein